VKILITGGAGFIGSLLARTLLARGNLDGRSIERLVLADQVAPAKDLLADPRVQPSVGQLLEQCDDVARARYDGVFHLASAVSAECEADFDLGMRSNLESTRALLLALRAAGNVPRLVFASSAAVFGGDPPFLPVPSSVEDHTLPTPQTSYGTQKLILEQLIMDFTRKGFLDGRAVRLLTVSVRPGRPNGAASGFLSGIVREPLAGVATTCPVPPETWVALASPARSIEALIRVYGASRAELGGRSALNLPALSVRVGDMLGALETVAGRAVRALVRFEPDARIEAIVSTWPARFRSERATRLGLLPDSNFESIIERYIADHPGALAARLPPLSSASSDGAQGSV
jgi:nucleoside-diphosphate-sugar epimerase